MLKVYTHKKLSLLCLMKGYSIEQIQDCIVEQKNESYILNTDHPSFPKVTKEGYSPPIIKFSNLDQSPTPINNGGNVGSELKKLLSKIGIKSTPNCSCNKKAALMDQNGIEWWAHKNAFLAQNSVFGVNIVII